MLLFSLEKIFFSLINSFFFSIWTAENSLHSVLTTIQISKKKELIAEKKKFLSEKKLRMRALPFQCNAFPATKKIYSLLSPYTVLEKQIWTNKFLPLYLAFFRRSSNESAYDSLGVDFQETSSLFNTLSKNNSLGVRLAL